MPAGNFPEWQLCIQTMDPAQEGSLDFDPLDSTKIWPEVRSLVPRCCCLLSLLRSCKFFCLALQPCRVARCLQASGQHHVGIADCGAALLGLLAGAVPAAASRHDAIRPQCGQLVHGERLNPVQGDTLLVPTFPGAVTCQKCTCPYIFPGRQQVHSQLDHQSACQRCQTD